MVYIICIYMCIYVYILYIYIYIYIYIYVCLLGERKDFFQVSFLFLSFLPHIGTIDNYLLSIPTSIQFKELFTHY